MSERYRVTANDPPTKSGPVEWICPNSGETIEGSVQVNPGCRPLWFLPPPNEMYVYYEPAFWREAASYGGEG